jgi:alpha-tubulin suppressor-like RCC1 family protein
MNGKRWIGLVALSLLHGCSDSTAPSGAAHLAFDVRPAAVGVGAGFAPTVVVSVRDDAGDVVADWSEAITLTLDGAGPAQLQGGGPTTPATGLATFDGLTVPEAGTGYTLVARSGSLTEVRSDPFDVIDVLHVTDVVAGAAHSCGLDLQGGTAYCWGRNDHGQLGDGTTTTRTRPVRVEGTFDHLVAAADHTCALGRGDGSVWCWGSNRHGQLGLGTTSDALEPTRVALPGPALQVGVGYWHACALLATGDVHCWGGNVEGMLGTGSTSEVVTAPQPVAGGMTFTAIAVGYEHVCGLTEMGALYCWGGNTYGQIGDGTQWETRDAPTPVSGGRAFARVFAGGGGCHGQTCGITPEGDTWCWGRNYQRGTGGVTDLHLLVPTPLQEDPGFERVIIGPFVLCGITAGGEPYCWGETMHGELGNGPSTSVTRPTRILSGRGVQSVAIGERHVCAVTSGDVLCWGENTSGQLGNPSNAVGWMVPVPVWVPYAGLP